MREIAKKYKASRRKERLFWAWKLVRSAASLPDAPRFWEEVKSQGVKEEDVKDALRFLEEMGELKIKRSVDGRRLYVSTLKGIRRNPSTLDRWIRTAKPQAP
ncbi:MULTISPECIES: hypothetical protein [unclassified Thermococcus]|uniref:hypothetical protein n=1 Tax=unclassified Thermococcus TaxID=2627626 RepID=UPI00142F41F9|nr:MULTISPECIES: hypothetical protein [unclassified Thermococcus]NJE47866.1 hypothetical protein [Thermococcus sp. GR7]NJF26033.1 hypothetical protein [Thermococcus sp. Bubb.Bath]